MCRAIRDRVRTIGSGDSDGGCHVIIGPVELSGSGVIAGSIGEGVGSHINGRCACCTWRKSSGVDGRAGGREIADRTPETVISLAAKLDVASLEVKVRVSVASLVVAPSATALEPSVAVIAMVGTTLSKVQLNWVAAVRYCRQRP